MAIVHEFRFTPAPGTTLIKISAWADTLPADQKTEFYAAEQRHIAAKAQSISQGNLVVEQGKYVWKDAAAAQQNIPMDPVWLRYFNRYLSENNITFNKITTEI